MWSCFGGGVTILRAGARCAELSHSPQVTGTVLQGMLQLYYTHCHLQCDLPYTLFTSCSIPGVYFKCHNVLHVFVRDKFVVVYNYGSTCIYIAHRVKNISKLCKEVSKRVPGRESEWG